MYECHTNVSPLSIVAEQHPNHAFVKVSNPKDLTVRPTCDKASRDPTHPCLLQLKQSHFIGRTVHNARCDGESLFLGVSRVPVSNRSFGPACGKQILGIRYKCLHPSCPDYDLCENCEALPIAVHPSSHALIKVRQPAHTYEGLQKIFKFARGQQEMAQTSAPVTIVGPATGRSTEVLCGADGILNFMPVTCKPSQPNTTVPEVPTPFIPLVLDEPSNLAASPPRCIGVWPASGTALTFPPIESYEEVSVEGTKEMAGALIDMAEPKAVDPPEPASKPTCILPALPAVVPTAIPSPAPLVLNRQWWEQLNDPVERQESPRIYQGVGEKEKDVVSIHSSRASSASPDIVEKTEELSLDEHKQEAINDESPFTDDNAVRSPSPMSATSSSFQSVIAPLDSTPRASFVSDNTIPDGFVVPAGTHFVKSWKLVNDGAITWPTASKLSWTAGDRLGTTVGFSVAAPSDVKVGAFVDLSVDFVAPSVPGHYISYWSLKDNEGEVFGHRLWCDIEVIDSPENSVNGSMHSSTVILPAPASLAPTPVVVESELPSPVFVSAPLHAGTPTVSSGPSEVDVASIASENDSESDISDVWEDASRAPSPDEFVIVYDSAEE